MKPVFVFDRHNRRIFLYDRSCRNFLFCFPAHNDTVKPFSDPFAVGANGPCPDGFLAVSAPDFISEDYRREFYLKKFGKSDIISGESYVLRWGDYSENDMGKVRFALGLPDAPRNTPDAAAWDRELLIHSGREFSCPTHGCIRLSSGDMEELAFHYIYFRRRSVVIDCLMVCSFI